MGVTVHYQGRFADLDRIEDFEDRVLDLVLEHNGRAEVWRSSPEHNPDWMTRGLLVNLEPGQDTFSLLVTPEGWLITPFQLEEAEAGPLAEPPWCFCKTQFGTVLGHVALVEILAAIKREFIPNLEIQDEGGYWESRDVKQLAQKKAFLDKAIRAFQTGLQHHGLTDEAAEDIDILLTRVERIAAKVQRIIGRPSEHPPLTSGADDDDWTDQPRDITEVEAEADAFFRHTERRKEQLNRAIEERMQRGEDHRTAFENAMRDIGLSVPGDPDWDADGDEFDTELSDDFDDESWRESLSDADEADDDSDPFSGDVTDADDPFDDRHEHPLLRQAQNLWHEFQMRFDGAADQHEPQLRILFRGIGDAVGGLAQATSRDFDDEDDSAMLREIQFGLSFTQLKRALRGTAFAQGALLNLRSLATQPDIDQLLDSLKQLRLGITTELSRIREQFQSEE